MHRVMAVSAALVVASAGCGSGDESRGSGAGGSGGGESCYGALCGGTTSSGPSSCPDEEPAGGAACTTAGQVCSYLAECDCPHIATCESGSWKYNPTDCAAPSCPTEPPEAGSACSCQALPCSYEVTCPDVTFTTTIEIACVGRTWQLQTSCPGS
jgi:hypothetical protein